MECRAPCADHFWEDLMIHDVTIGNEGIVIALMPESALDLETGDWCNHAGVAVARAVHVHGRAWAQIGGRLAVCGNLVFAAGCLHAGDPVRVPFEPVGEVFLGIELRDFSVPVGQQGMDLGRVDGFEEVQWQPCFEAGAAA